MRHLLIAYIVFLSSCGASSNQGLRIDMKYQIYFDSFQQELRSRNVDIKITNLTITSNPNLPPTVEGLCITNPNSPPIIQINPTIWPALEADREGLLYHEFGHCILGRGHIEGMIRGPASSPIINAYSSCLGKIYQYNQSGVNFIISSLMSPCSGIATVLYSTLNTTPVFDVLTRTYYVDELIANRVVGNNSGF